MKNEARKLTLTRETLLPLQDHELGAVNGGTTPASPATGLITLSFRFCVAASAATLKATNSLAQSTKPWKANVKKALKYSETINPSYST